MSKSEVTIFRVIDRKTARYLGKVFMACYRKGINDACLHIEDEGLINEHIELTRSGEVHGFIGQTNESQVYWHNRLCELAEQHLCFKPIMRYFERVGRFGGNYLSVASVIAQEFYSMGLADYLAYNYNDLVKFNQSQDLRLRWTPKGLKRFDVYKFRAMIQDMCAVRISKIKKGEKDALKINHYEIFSNAFSFAIVTK